MSEIELVASFFSLIYLSAGALISMDAFTRADKFLKHAAMDRLELKSAWENHRKGDGRSPGITVEQWDAGIEANTVRSQAMRAQAYRTIPAIPVWPLIIARDVRADYRRAKAGETVFNIEASARALEASVAYDRSLRAAQKKAQHHIDEAVQARESAQGPEISTLDKPAPRKWKDRDSVTKGCALSEPAQARAAAMRTDLKPLTSLERDG